MICKQIFIFLMNLTFLVYHSGEALVYTASPGLQPHDQHQDVTLSWRVSYTGVGYRFWVIYLYHGDFCLITMSGGILRDCDGTRRGLLFVNDTHVDYTVEDVSLDDAGQYSCAILIGTPFYNDSNAALYIFNTPDKPSILPSGPYHEGSRLTLQCYSVSTSLPAANQSQVNVMYTWRNNSADLDPGKLPERYSITSRGDPANAVNDLLVITSLSRHDAGSYTCKAQEDGSDLQSPFSNVYNLEPLYAPGRASPGEDQTVDVGNDVTLSCSADDLGRPDGSWIWTTPDGDVDNTSEVGRLTIAEITVRSDDGEYSCHLNNHVGDGARGNMRVTVQEMPSLDVIEDISFSNTEQLNVSCKAKARPVANITWKYANGSSLPFNVFTWTSLPGSGGKYTVTSSYLQWTVGSSPDGRRHKGGDINCVASNVVGGVTTGFILDVQFAPFNVQVKRTAEIIEYESLGPVLCTAMCNPPCTYSWYKEGAQVSSNAELMIPNVTRDDHGVYECLPDNGILGGQTAELELTVFYGPSDESFEVITPAGPINQTDDVTFLCQTDSRPMPVITLIRPSGDMLVSSSTRNTLQYTLTDIDCLDSGVYRCEANNYRTGRSDHHSLSIAAQCPPRKHLTSDVMVGATEGDTVTFSITAIASPQPTFKWFFNETQLPDQSYVTASYSRGFVSDAYVNSTLTLYSVTQGDFGNYGMTASNTLGAMEDVSFSLIPAGPPVAPGQLVASHSNAVSITMHWTSGWNRGGEQVFTLMYRRSDSDDSYTNITGISDPGQRETVTSKARNLTSDSKYDFIAVAGNQYGSTQSQLSTATTRGQPDLGLKDYGDFSIGISNGMATITWSLHSYSGPITHVDVNSCVSDSTKCILTTKVSPTTRTVEVAVPEGGSSYTFEFRVYDGEDVILGLKYVTKDHSGQPIGTIVGVVIAVLLLAVLVTGVGVIARRRRSLTRDDDKNKTEARISNDKRDGSTDSVVQYENVLLHGKTDFLPQSDPGRTQPEVDVYETIEVSDDVPVPTQNDYEFPQRSRIPNDVSASHYEALRSVNTDSRTTDQTFNCVELSEYANINLMSSSNSGV